MVFIVFEGSEGVGKTTQINLVAQKLGVCLRTREPGGTPLGEDIRTLFKKHLTNKNSLLAELFLMVAARCQHVEQYLLPRLQEQEIVLCDRFLDSTYVYQGICGGVEKSLIDSLHRPFLQHLVPDLTLILQTQQTTAQGRITARQGVQVGDGQGGVESPEVLDRFDALVTVNGSSLLHDAFQKLYHERWAYPSGIVPCRVLVDGEGAPEDVFQRIWPLVQGVLSRGKIF